MNDGAHTRLIRQGNQGCVAKNGAIITASAGTCRTYCNTAPRTLKGQKIYAKKSLQTNENALMAKALQSGLNDAYLTHSWFFDEANKLSN